MGEDILTTEMIFNERMIQQKCGGVTTEAMAALTQIKIGSGA